MPQEQTVAPAPEITPVLLDVTPVTPIPAVTPAPPAPAEVGQGIIEYEPTDDVGLNLALDFVGKAGIGPDHPAMKAAHDGDFSILKAVLAAKGTSGWEQAVALGELAFERSQAENKAKAEAVEKTVHKVAGGAQEWTNVQTWASANATPEEKTEINNLLNAGGLAAAAAAQYLVAQYSRASGVEVTPKDPVAGASRATLPGADQGPLDAEAYTKAVAALNVKTRGRLDDSPEYQKLQNRRLAWRG